MATSPISCIKPSTGVRQGCPLSPYLFLVAAEHKSMKIRQTSAVKGISIFEREIKISQFADDTTLPAVFRPLFGGKRITNRSGFRRNLWSNA